MKVEEAGQNVTMKTITGTGCSLNIVSFPYNFVIFLNSASSAVALVFYLPCVCTHNDTNGKQRKTRVRNILKSLEKNTIFHKHPVLLSPYFLVRYFIVAFFWLRNPIVYCER